jgi:hypothetical protein
MELQALVESLPSTNPPISPRDLNDTPQSRSAMHGLLGLEVLSVMLEGRESNQETLQYLTARDDQEEEEGYLELAVLSSTIGLPLPPGDNTKLTASSTFIWNTAESYPDMARCTMASYRLGARRHSVRTKCPFTASPIGYDVTLEVSSAYVQSTWTDRNSVPGGTKLSDIPKQGGALDFAIKSALWSAYRHVDFCRQTFAIGTHSVVLVSRHRNACPILTLYLAIERFRLVGSGDRIKPRSATDKPVGPRTDPNMDSQHSLGQYHTGLLAAR